MYYVREFGSMTILYQTDNVEKAISTCAKLDLQDEGSYHVIIESTDGIVIDDAEIIGDAAGMFDDENADMYENYADYVNCADAATQSGLYDHDDVN